MKTIVLIALVALLAGCAGQKRDAASNGAAPGANTGTTMNDSQPSATAPVYVDVRTAEEFNAGHVAGAIHIPYDEMPDRWKELEAYRDKPVVLYCRTGRRSGIALDVLEEKGFIQAQNGGGFDDMKAQGLPVE